MCSVAALALFAGCKGDEPLADPQESELTLLQTVVEVSADGGHFEVGYELKNPSIDGKLTINSEGHDCL